MAKGDVSPPIRLPFLFFSLAESFRFSSCCDGSSVSSLLGSTGPAGGEDETLLMESEDRWRLIRNKWMVENGTGCLEMALDIKC